MCFEKAICPIIPLTGNKACVLKLQSPVQSAEGDEVRRCPVLYLYAESPYEAKQCWWIIPLLLWQLLVHGPCSIATAPLMVCVCVRACVWFEDVSYLEMDGINMLRITCHSNNDRKWMSFSTKMRASGSKTRKRNKRWVTYIWNTPSLFIFVCLVDHLHRLISIKNSSVCIIQ